MNIENGFKIFHTIFLKSFLIKKDVKKNVERFGLSETEVRFMFFIGLGNGERRINEFISFSGKHKSTVRQKLLSLEKNNFININICDEDKREKKVSFTKKGKNLFQKILNINNSYQEKVFKQFSKKEIEMLLSLLKKIHTNN